jgi:O-antigen ligase
MDATSMRLRAAPPGQARRVDWGAAPTWLLCVGLIVYLGLRGGGYDPLVHDQVGIAVWWIALAGVLVGALPRRPQGALAWTALGLLAAFVVWSALSLSWTESVERTAEELALVTTYLGVFVLALGSRARGGSQRVVCAVAVGIVVVSVVALLSRLHPAWFPAGDQTAAFLSSTRERLSYPLNYWNGLAALIAIGLPLLLQIATDVRSLLLRAAAAATLPAMALTVFFTLSRGGIAAAAIALAVYLAFAPDRLPKLLTLLLTGAGGAILIAAATQRDALQQALLNEAAHRQGNEMLAMTVVVCVVVGLLHAGISRALGGERRPRWAFVSRRQTWAAAIGVSLAVLIAAAALDAPGRASDGWAEFKQGGGPGKGTGRLASAAGQSRYQFWAAAVRENATDPPIGTGAGTFEYWWARNGDAPDIVRDTHSLYFQTLGELGIVGIALLAAFLLTILAGGGRAVLRAGSRSRAPLAAALAGCTAFCLVAATDWIWQIPVLPVALLLLAAPLVASRGEFAGGGRRAMQLPFRLAFVPVAAAAVVAIAIPLASSSLVRQSEADARGGDLAAALSAARSAQNVQPDAATPRLQQALVLEAQGELSPAAEAARAATERESTNWRTWLVLSRIEAERGHAAAAVVAYRRARSLNPRSALFQR